MLDLTHPSSVARTVGLVVPMLVALIGCNRDPLAPDCFEPDPGENGCLVPFPGATDITADCTNFPQAAVGAEYYFDASEMTSGGTGQFSDWSATNLPPGLTIDPNTGIISGVPEAPGDLAYNGIVISVVDQFTGESFDFECGELVVNDALNAFEAMGEPLHCIDASMDFDQWVGILRGGDGTEITCLPLNPGNLPCPLGDGDGRMPPGISFNESSCTHSGSLSSTRRGTWVWMVEIEQSGYRTSVPFCASNDVSTYHNIGHTVMGSSETDLLPGAYAHDPNAALSFGNGDYSWSIFDPACMNDPAQCNSFGFRFDVTCSPFDPPFQLNGMSDPLGMVHGMVAQGPAPSSSFHTRPWVASFEMSYCTSANGANCDVNDPNFDSNAQTQYHYDVIGYPVLGGP